MKYQTCMNHMKTPLSFQELLKHDLETTLNAYDLTWDQKDTLKIDLHCHDYNSNEPEEILGRILNLPETWLCSRDLLRILKENGTDGYTITNHNNARSCFELQNKGIDILTGAEYTCFVPDFGVSIHVLAYGFNQDQDAELEKHRKNLYAFLGICQQQRYSLLAWAHPLYYYAKHIPSISFFEKMSVVFTYFETLNGQRDTWQNMLTKEWVERLCTQTGFRIQHQSSSWPHHSCS
jgi:hypothetical protein